MEEHKKNSGQTNKPEQKQSQREILETEAFQLRTEGKTLFALEKIEEAMKSDQRWYHFFYKAIWLYDSKKFGDAVKVIEYGENLGKGKKFYFTYLGAEFLFRAALASASTVKKIDNAINELNDAIRYADTARSLFVSNGEEIEKSRKQIPNELKKLWPTFINTEDLNNELLNLRTRTEITRNSMVLFKGIMDTEKRVNASIERNRQRIDSERVRTVELLGIFTAVFAFIISGVQIFTRLPVDQALILQAGMALILTVFLLGVHLVLEPKARTKLLITILCILIILLVGLPVYAKFLQTV